MKKRAVYSIIIIMLVFTSCTIPIIFHFLSCTLYFIKICQKLERLNPALLDLYVTVLMKL